MILNSYAVLLAFVGLLRLPLGLLLLAVAAASAWRGPGGAPEERVAAEDRCYLVLLLALLLVGLNLASWPLLYLLVQSYVPQWPGVMGIYGVTQIGKGTLGPSRFLPDLLHGLQVSKPALVFLSGAWFVLYLLNRRTRTAPLLPRLFVVLLPLGALAAADAAAELAYLAVPKKEVLPPVGCCVLAEQEEAAARFLPRALFGEAAGPRVFAAYYATNLALIVALFAATRRAAPGALGLALLSLGGLAALGASGLFLIEVAAPRLLQLPDHHCPYDLIGQAPEAVAAVALFLGGCFFLGWAGVARWVGRCPATEPLLPGGRPQAPAVCLACFLTSLAMLSLELALA
jgi:hypothetical protein